MIGFIILLVVAFILAGPLGIAGVFAVMAGGFVLGLILFLLAKLFGVKDETLQSWVEDPKKKAKADAKIEKEAQRQAAIERRKRELLGDEL